MKLAIKIVAVLVVVYVIIVAGFETWLGTSQPAGGTTMVITTVDGSGHATDRVVSRLESGGQLYVAANHWPRAWYRNVLANPDVTVTVDGKTQAYRAVQVSAEEFERVDAEHSLGPMIRFLTGYPPRRLVRLDPVPIPAPPPQ